MCDNKNVTNVHPCCSGGSRRGRDSTPRSSGSTEDEETTIIYPTRMACYKALLDGMDKYPSSHDKVYNSNTNYTGDYNSWLMATGFVYTSVTTKYWAPGTTKTTTYESIRELRWSTDEGDVNVTSHGCENSIKCAKNRSAYNMWASVKRLVPKVQSDDSLESNQSYETALYEKLDWAVYRARCMMNGVRLPYVQIETPEKTTEQGDVTQTSVKESNTIITQDQQQSEAEPIKALDTTIDIVSSEEVHQFPTITGRWMPLDNVTVLIDQAYNTTIKAWFLPEALYATNCSPSLVPFETFIYARPDLEIRVVVNANKFSCGKLVLSAKYDTYQADAICATVQAALARNHIILDLSANNEGLLTIPFRFHRPAMRLLASESSSSGVRTGKYATLFLQVLSPLQTGTGGTSDINLTLFYRFKEVKFSAMSYRATVQGLGFEDLVTPTTSRPLKELLGGAERAFDQLGKTPNQDKPGVIGATPIVPRPRSNFACGKGMTDVVPLRLNPHTLTNYHKINVPTDEPRSFYDLARIWGIYRAFTWANTNAVGSELGSFVVDPTYRNVTDDLTIAVTPLEYAMENFSFWSGPIELRFDFVSNAYHTGTIQISAEFGRNTSSQNPCESQATYTKTFHLGDQKTVSFIIPYIYDTIYRRTTSIMCNPYQSIDSTTLMASKSFNVAPLSKTNVKIRVINALRPIAAAPQHIDVLVFMRAGREFSMHGLKGFSALSVNADHIMDEFPFDYPVRRTIFYVHANLT